MNLNQLKIFYFTVRHQTLGRAAEALCISQPAVSKGLKRFQAAQGVRLLVRSGKYLVPTHEGDALYHIAAQIFNLEDRADDLMSRLRKEGAGRVTVHAGDTFASHYLPCAVRALKRHCPRTRVTVEICHNSRILRNTLAFENDLGVVSGSPEHPDIEVLGSVADPLAVIMPPGHNLAGKEILVPADLGNQDIIMHEKGSVPFKLMQACLEKYGIPADPVMALSTNSAIVQAVLNGMGIALVSRWPARAEITRGTLAAVPLEGIERRNFHIIKHRCTALSETGRRLARLMAGPI